MMILDNDLKSSHADPAVNKELDDEFSNDKVHKWLEETYGSEGIGHAYGHTWKDPRTISDEARLQNSRSAQSGHTCANVRMRDA